MNFAAQSAAQQSAITSLSKSRHCARRDVTASTFVVCVCVCAACGFVVAARLRTCPRAQMPCQLCAFAHTHTLTYRIILCTIPKHTRADNNNTTKKPLASVQNIASHYHKYMSALVASRARVCMCVWLHNSFIQAALPLAPRSAPATATFWSVGRRRRRTDMSANVLLLGFSGERTQ